jgi:pimeloyl-ACP methyl ester carboxylesterase
VDLKKAFYWSAALIMAFLLPACSATLYRAGIDMERWRAGMKEKSLDAYDLHFSYLDGGSGANILMLHGFGSNKDSWNRFAGHLTDKFRVVAVDLPGHGDSTSSLDDTYDVQSQARRLTLFADRLGLQRFHIIGSSMGGAIAIHYTHLHPDRVMTMGLISSGGVMSPKPSEYMRKLEKGENPLLVRSKDDFDNMLKFVMVETPYIPWFIKNVVYEEYMARQAINERIFKDIATEEMVNMAFLPEINIPVFILWGDQDRVLDVSSVGVFEEQLPDTHSVILENTGHAPMVEAPEASAGHYLHFLGTYEK